MKEEIERDFYMLLEDIDSGEECLLSNHHIEIVSRLFAENFDQVKYIVENYESNSLTQ